MTSNINRTGAEVVVESLELQGVRYVFGIPGAKIDRVFEALASSHISTVVCRHEQNAAFIAGGIGRLTGKAGVAIVTSGPGVSNLTTGLATANSEGDPVVALGGAVPTSQNLKQIHQTLQAVPLMKAVTKFSGEASSPASIGEVMANAFRAAESERPGAAFVSLPKDVMEGLQPACEAIPVSLRSFLWTRAPTHRWRKQPTSSKPQRVLWYFSECWRADLSMQRRSGPSLRKTHLPVVGTFQAAGTVSTDLFQRFAGRVGQLANTPGDELLASADCDHHHWIRPRRV